NREGTIYPYRDGRWCGQVTVGKHPVSGRPIRETFYGDTQEEVQEKILNRRKELLDTGLMANDQTVVTLADFSLATVRPSLSNSSRSRYARDVSYFVPHIGSILARKLTAWDVARAYEQMTEAGVPPASLRNAGIRLRQILEYATKARMVAFNAAKAVP